MSDAIQTKEIRGTSGVIIDPEWIKELISLAIKALRQMQLESGTFCERVYKNDPRRYGVSIRYSLIVLLGLKRAQSMGLAHPFDEEKIRKAVSLKIFGTNIAAGDLGLYFWAMNGYKIKQSGDLIVMLKNKIESKGGLLQLQGMELAWIVIGLAFSMKLYKTTVGSIFQKALSELKRRIDAKTGLLHHIGTNHPRKWLPNFATQIYGVLAFAIVTDLGLDNNVLKLAKIIADRLIELQLPDGGWPWLFNARSGRIAEAYELYSVHQHGMAPMALLKLTEISGDSRYSKAAIKGLEWIYGNNKLKRLMIDDRQCLIYRSIRRKRPWNKLALYANAGLSFMLDPKVFDWNGLTELNSTCYSYEMGWLLMAWCGRESYTII